MIGLSAEDRFELRNCGAVLGRARGRDLAQTCAERFGSPARLQPVKLAGTIVSYTDGTLNLVFCSIEG